MSFEDIKKMQRKERRLQRADAVCAMATKLLTKASRRVRNAHSDLDSHLMLHQVLPLMPVTEPARSKQQDFDDIMDEMDEMDGAVG